MGPPPETQSHITGSVPRWNRSAASRVRIRRALHKENSPVAPCEVALHHHGAVLQMSNRTGAIYQHNTARSRRLVMRRSKTAIEGSSGLTLRSPMRASGSIVTLMHRHVRFRSANAPFSQSLGAAATRRLASWPADWKRFGSGSIVRLQVNYGPAESDRLIPKFNLTWNGALRISTATEYRARLFGERLRRVLRGIALHHQCRRPPVALLAFDAAKALSLIYPTAENWRFVVTTAVLIFHDRLVDLHLIRAANLRVVRFKLSDPHHCRCPQSRPVGIPMRPIQTHGDIVGAPSRANHAGATDEPSEICGRSNFRR